MSERFQIRGATRGDIASLSNIEAAAARLFPTERIPDPESTHAVDALEQSLQNGLLFVAAVEGEVVGFCTCTEVDQYLNIDELSVHPDFGKRGIGRALIERAIEESGSRKLAAVTLTTFADFAWNAPFYRRLGFAEVDAADLPVHVRDNLAQEAREGLVHRVGMVYSHVA